jgi:hypothetical protein
MNGADGLYTDLANAVPDILALASRAPIKLIRIEGAMGVGKSRLSRLLEAEVGGLRIECDDFLDPERGGTYAARMRVDNLHAAVMTGLRSQRWVILEGICLDEVAPEAVLGRGVRIYVKRVSVLGPELLMWHDFDEGGRIPQREAYRSVHEYHLDKRPHERADLVIARPDRPLPG